MPAWHQSACNGNVYVLLNVWEWTEEKLRTEKINNTLLLATDNERWTAWHYAAHEVYLDILLELWE